MNYDDIAFSIAHGEKIYNLPLRVTYYCRVSTDSDVQLNSLDNQLDYYKNYIKSKPTWTFVDGYIEEGVTGVSVDKRVKFKKMISDAKRKKFDLIITKEVSRFARDLEDSIHYIRELKECNVGVFFENQNLNTFDPNSELILNIMFNIAQDESKKLSSRIKFGHKQAIEKGHVLGSSNIIGYKKEKCKLVIVQEEAKFVQIVFELYASGEYGFYRLGKKLASLGFYNKKGRIYDKDTLKRIITNPKYKGFYRGHTYEIMDYRTKRRKKIPVNEQVIYKCMDNSIPSIVSEQLWDKANERLNNRMISYQNNNHWSFGLKYSFSSKIYCKEHNTTFQRSHGKVRVNRPTWSCGMYLNYRLDACASPVIAEKDLYNIMNIIMNNIITNKEIIIQNMLEIYKSVNNKGIYADELRLIEKNIEKIEKKKSFALDLVFSGDLKKEELKKQFINYENDLEKFIKNKNDLLKEINKMEKYNTNIEKLSNAINEELNGGFQDEFIRHFVDEIIVSKIKDNRYNIRLDIYLNLLGSELPKIRGARHINGTTDRDVPFIFNQDYSSVEVLREDRKLNKFNYNVYLESPY